MRREFNRGQPRKNSSRECVCMALQGAVRSRREREAHTARPMTYLEEEKEEGRFSGHGCISSRRPRRWKKCRSAAATTERSINACGGEMIDGGGGFWAESSFSIQERDALIRNSEAGTWIYRSNAPAQVTVLWDEMCVSLSCNKCNRAFRAPCGNGGAPKCISDV